MVWLNGVVNIFKKVAVLATCGAVAWSAPVVGAVEGGHDAVATPWAAKVLVSGLCSGSVVSPHWVLTAQHCVGNQQSGTVKLGEKAEGDYPIDRVVVHPSGADIALVHTAEAMPVAPAVLSGVIPPAGQVSQISGWGAGRYPLQQGTAKVVGHYDDNDGRGNAKMFVTRGVVGNQEPGDSGGPFHAGPIVFGVISAVGAKDEGGHIAANYTAVAPMLPWVYAIIAEPSQLSTGSA